MKESFSVEGKLSNPENETACDEDLTDRFTRLYSNSFFKPIPPHEWKKILEERHEEIEAYDRNEILHAHGLDHEIDGTFMRVLLTKDEPKPDEKIHAKKPFGTP